MTVEVVGEANVIPGNILNTKKFSLDAAKRKAVEEAVGTLVTGQMVVSKARLIEDQIFSRTAGYLREWQVLSEEEVDGLYRTRIRAAVKFGDVRNDLDGLGLLIQTRRVGNPRVMLLIDERVDGKESDSRTIETGLAAQLLDKGYKVVDRDQIAEIRKEEAVVRAMKGGEAEAADLAKRFGAEIALLGGVDARLYTAPGEGAGGGLLGDMVSYRGRLNLKAVKAASGEMVLALTKEGAGMDVTKEGAAARCLSSLAGETGGELSEKLAPALWKGSEVQLVLAGVPDLSFLQRIVGGIRAADGVNNVVTRKLDPQESVLMVELYGGDAQTLAAQMEGRLKLPIQIGEVTAYRIVGTVKTAGGTE